MRIAYSLLALVCLEASAMADTDLVVLGPVTDAKVTPARANALSAALTTAGVGAVSSRKIDVACASDAVCLGIVGVDLKANRVLAISATATAVELVLVDVAGKELVAKRDIVLADRNVARELPLELKKFLDSAPIERAKTLFAQGNQHYALGEFVSALEFYRRAYRIKPLPAFLFNIAQCHRKLGQHHEAVTMYQSYLAGVPDAQNKALVESLMAESKGKLAEEQRVADLAAQARRDVERLELERQRAEADRKAKEAVAMAAAERTKIEQARLAAEHERALEKTYNKHPARKWTIALGGVGAGALIAGGVFGFSARNAQSAFDDAGCGNPERVLDQPALAKCVDDRDRGKRSARLGSILLVSGGALLATSLVVFVLDPGNLARPERPRTAVAIAPGSVQLVVQW